MAAQEGAITILIVEDNEGDINSFKEIFSNYHYFNEIHWARNGDEALRILREERPELTIIDPFLSGMTGEALLSQIRAGGEFQRTYVIMLTKDESEEEWLRRMMPSTDGFMRKPITLENLANMISKIDHFHVGIVKVAERGEPLPRRLRSMFAR